MNLFSKSADVRPDTSLITPSHDELVIRVNVLAGEIARLTRELADLRQTPVAAVVEPRVIATVGPVPATPAEGTSGRSLMRYIAIKLGGTSNEDSVRKNLTHGKAFADLRAQAPDICTNVPLMRWLASEQAGWGASRYAIIAAEAATARELAEETRA